MREQGALHVIIRAIATGRRDGRPVVSRVSEKQHILVVDDEPLILELVVAVLDDPRFDVHIEERVAEAVAYTRSLSGALDLLVTDMSMPEASGEELAMQLASSCPGLRVLLMSGRPEDSEIARAHPGWDYVRKPFSIPDLLDKVEALLSRER